MFKVKINRSSLTVLSKEAIASGASKIYKVSFDFDPFWVDFFKTAVFKAGDLSFSVLIEGNSCHIPHEVLCPENAGKILFIGAYGTDKDGARLPTVWNKLGVIQPGTEPCESAKSPSPTVIDSIYASVRSSEEKIEKALVEIAVNIDMIEESASITSKNAQRSEECMDKADTAADAAVRFSSDAKEHAESAREDAIAADSAARRAEEAASRAESIADGFTTFHSISEVVKAGSARLLYPVGTQITVNHAEYGNQLYEVVAHDHFRKAGDPEAHTMTLCCKRLLAARPFDTKEALFCAETALSENTLYEINLPVKRGGWKAGRYGFETSFSLPEGTQFVIEGDTTTPLEELQVLCYASPYDTSPICGFNFTYEPSVSGISLGEVGKGRVNIHSRALYGSSNYAESDIRKYLDSDAESNYWTPTTMFDRIPENAAESGFIAGLDEDLRAVIGEVILPCCANDSYESPDSAASKGSPYDITSKVFLLSPNELGVQCVDDISASTPLEFYSDAANTDRIKYANGTSASYLTRCPEIYYSADVCNITSDGALTTKAAIAAVRFAPAFNIV
ncbi:MAG: DUF6273 domain-containing protein [Clostridia bacterium]|nr:DUF6273 domain-containing protein [Clostridia bacterium]